MPRIVAMSQFRLHLRPMDNQLDVEWPPLREPAGGRAWRQVLHMIGAALHEHAGELSEAIATQIREELPALFVDSQMFEEVKKSTCDSLRQLGRMIEHGEDPKNIDMPPSASALLRAGVWRNVPLAVNNRFYRLAQEHVWHWLFTEITKSAKDPDTLKTAAELATSWLLGFVDHALLLADEAYEEERDTWSRGASAARAAAIEDILADRERNERIASQRLRYEISRHHIGIIATAIESPEQGAPISMLSEAIASAGRTIGAETSITHPAGSLAIAGWLSARRPFPKDVIPGRDEGLRVWRLPSGVSIAVGEPAVGLSGFRSTHMEAQHAARVALLMSSHIASFTSYRDAALTALCTTDEQHATAFVRRVLGPLATDDKDSYRLAMTLAAYLRESLSRSRTAAVLQIHPNTVSYRVRQAEELLQRNFERETLDLEVALALLPALPRLESSRRPYRNNDDMLPRRGT